MTRVPVRVIPSIWKADGSVTSANSSQPGVCVSVAYRWPSQIPDGFGLLGIAPIRDFGQPSISFLQFRFPHRPTQRIHIHSCRNQSIWATPPPLYIIQLKPKNTKLVARPNNFNGWSKIGGTWLMYNKISLPVSRIRYFE
jgi:hypothetical protein